MSIDENSLKALGFRVSADPMVVDESDQDVLAYSLFIDKHETVTEGPVLEVQICDASAEDLGTDWMVSLLQSGYDHDHHVFLTGKIYRDLSEVEALLSALGWTAVGSKRG